MARKPLIQPGSVLPPASDTDDEGGVLGRIIANDRERNGRGAPLAPPQDENTRNVTTLQSSNAETPQQTNAETIVSRNDASSEGTKERENAGSNDVRNGAVGGTVREMEEAADARMALALERAGEDEVAVVTVRAPQKLNTYIDRYVERINRISPKRRYRKQDAVAEMFAWFYASHPMPPAPEEEDL